MSEPLSAWDRNLTSHKTSKPEGEEQIKARYRLERTLRGLVAGRRVVVSLLVLGVLYTIEDHTFRFLNSIAGEGSGNALALKTPKTLPIGVVPY
jgi:hypothetical protein